jgi:Tfp pilus assembly protein PilX
MFVLLMLTAMTLLLLGGAQTTALQTQEQIALTRASLAADAAVSHGFLRLRSGPAPTAGSPVTVTNRSFGGGNTVGNFEGQFDYRISLAQDAVTTGVAPAAVTVTRVYLVEGEGRVRTGNNDWTRSGMQQWIRESITTPATTPPSGGTPAAVTVCYDDVDGNDNADDDDLPDFTVTNSGGGAISGKDHSLAGNSVVGTGGSALIVTDTDSAWSGSGVPSTLETSTGVATHLNTTPYSTMQSYVESLRQTSLNTATTYGGDDKYTLPASGSAVAPVAVKVELTGDKGTVVVKNAFYGLLIVKVKAGWTGKSGAAVEFSGNPEFKGLVFVEFETLGEERYDGDPLILLNGGGAVVNSTGAFILDITRTAAADFKADGGETKNLIHMNGGGKPGERNFVFSSAGVGLANSVVTTPPTTTTTVYALVAHRVAGALGLAP